MKVYILFQDTEEYDSQSTVVDVFASEGAAIKAMETAVLREHETGHWRFEQVSPTKWVRPGHEGDGYHVEPWEVIG